MPLLSMVKFKVIIIHLLISRELFYWTQSTRKNFVVLHISIPYGFPAKLKNRLCGDVPYFLWHGTRPSYKHIKIWGVILYIINVHATRKKLYDRSYRGYFYGIWSYYRSYSILETISTIYYSQSPSCLFWWI